MSPLKIPRANSAGRNRYLGQFVFGLEPVRAVQHVSQRHLGEADSSSSQLARSAFISWKYGDDLALLGEDVLDGLPRR